MKTIIHVNQGIIKSNRKHGENAPVLTVKTYKSNNYAHEVVIDGPCKIVYRPDKPLSCGAHVWIETQHNVLVMCLPSTLQKENKDVKNISSRRERKCTKGKCTK